jgi:hypothetical protein
MKESTKKLINEQIKKVLAELEQVEDVADRVELRIEAIEMIYKVSGDSNIDMPQGKNSIRENKAKEPVVVEEYEEDVLAEPEDVPEIPEEMVNEVEPEPELPEVEELEEVSMDEILNAKDNLDPEVAAQAASEIEEEEINPEEEELPEVPEDIQAEFDSLESIANVNAEVVEHKIFIANWIHEDDVETVELYINYFASNIEEDENGDPMYVGEELHLNFLNENNIAGFIDYINVLSE